MDEGEGELIGESRGRAGRQGTAERDGSIKIERGTFTRVVALRHGASELFFQKDGLSAWIKNNTQGNLHEAKLRASADEQGAREVVEESPLVPLTLPALCRDGTFLSHHV